ncbi:MAG: hypothetical protein ACOYNI_05320 [Acidimicrobiia bacterium]
MTGGTGSDELPKVTMRLLRAAAAGCPRRLMLSYDNMRGQRGSKFRNRAEDRVREDARLAHATMRAPTLADFPVATDLLPEEQALHAAAARAYVALFGDHPAVTAEYDEWATVRADLGFRLLGPLGLVVELADGTQEIRRLRFGRSDAPDDVELRFCAARLSRSDVRIVTADLVNVTRHETTASIDPFENDAWMKEQVRVATNRGAEPTITEECAYCEYITDCKAHR